MDLSCLYRHTASRFALLAVVILVAWTVRPAAEMLEFDGRIEATTQAYVYSRVEGRVAEVYAVAGQEVKAGELLARLEDDLAHLAVDLSAAELMRAEALVARAMAQLARAERLSQSGAGSGVRLEEAGTDLALARADRRAAQVQLDQARTALAETEIRAPVAGFVEAPRAVIGAILEFDAALPPLFEIVQLDPVRVVYAVPYDERLAQLDRTGAGTARALLDRVRLDLVRADGMMLVQGARPGGTSVRVDPETGTLDVWADIPNPEGVLRPGMTVIVRSTIGDATATE